MRQLCVCRDIEHLGRLELHSAAPRATLTPLSCSPNFPRAQYLDIRTLTHELIVKYKRKTIGFQVHITKILQKNLEIFEEAVDLFRGHLVCNCALTADRSCGSLCHVKAFLGPSTEPRRSAFVSNIFSNFGLDST